MMCADWLAYALWPFVSSDSFANRTIPEIRESLRVQTAPERVAPPPRKRAEEFTIGVFGGSLAKMLGDVWARDWETVPASRSLSAATGRPLKILNLAIMAGSEPQQYNFLRLFHDRIDLAVFVDGFNEMSSSQGQIHGRPGCEVMEEFWRSNAKSEEELLQPLTSAYERLRRLSAKSWIWWPLRFSALFKLYLMRTSTQFYGDISTYLQTFGVADEVAPAKLAPQKRVDNWALCEEHVVQFARQVELPILLFLQPNLHVDGSKTFTDEETELRSNQGAYVEIPECYWAASNRIRELQAHGLPIESLVGVFEDIDQTVYVDSCCHVNDLGSQLMADAISKKILETLPIR